MKKNQKNMAVWLKFAQFPLIKLQSRNKSAENSKINRGDLTFKHRGGIVMI